MTARQRWALAVLGALLLAVICMFFMTPALVAFHSVTDEDCIRDGGRWDNYRLVCEEG